MQCNACMYVCFQCFESERCFTGQASLPRLAAATQLVEELLPACKQAGATKASVLAARLKLFQKYEKA